MAWEDLNDDEQDRVAAALHGAGRRRFIDLGQSGHRLAHPDEGLYGIEPSAFIERIIIGPTANPEPTREGLVETLRAAGAAEPERRVVVSAIPLRR